MKVVPISKGSEAPAQTGPDQPSIRTIKIKTNFTPVDANKIQTPEAPQTEADPKVAKPPQTEKPANSEPQVQPGAEDKRPVDPQVAAIVKAKRALQEKEVALKAREDALKAKESGVETETLDQFKARVKAEPLRVLLEIADNPDALYKQLTDAVLKDMEGNSPTVQRLEREIAAMKAEKDTSAKTQTEQDAKDLDEALGYAQAEADQLIASDDQYAPIRELGFGPKVRKLIKSFYDERGRWLEPTEALNLILTDIKSQAQKLAKFAEGSTGSGPAAQTTQTRNQPNPQMRTITNRDSTVPTLSRKERAVLAAQGRLPKVA